MPNNNTHPMYTNIKLRHLPDQPYKGSAIRYPTYGTTCCSKYHSYHATKTSSICFCHFFNFLFLHAAKL